MSSDQQQIATPRTVSGRVIVIGLFLLGITATGVLWTYWHLHLVPFMPLQESLAAEFEHSSPRVDGGRRKMHKGTPKILRVVMRVPFDPTDAEADVQNQIEQRMTRVMELATQHTPIGEYDLLEVHLYQETKEDELRQKTFLKDLKSLEEAGA